MEGNCGHSNKMWSTKSFTYPKKRGDRNRIYDTKLSFLTLNYFMDSQGGYDSTERSIDV